MHMLCFLLTLLPLVSCFEVNNSSARDDSFASIARTINLGSIDFDAIFNRLISPSGLVTQFALELEVQAIFTIGWIILGQF